MTKNNNQAKYLVEAKGPEIQLSAEELLSTRHLKYMMVNVISRRARELNRGEVAQVEVTQPHTPVELAIGEVKSGILTLVRKPKSKVLVSLIKTE